MTKTILQTALFIFAFGQFTACSKADDNKENKGASSDKHSYHIEITDGKTYQGDVPKATGGVYYPVSIVEYSKEINGKILAGVLMEAGQFQFGIGLALDTDNQPSLQGSGPGLAFGEWGSEEKYGPAGPINMTLKNYQEHTITLYGEKTTVASYTLTFNGKFKLGTEGEEVDVTGELVIAAP